MGTALGGGRGCSADGGGALSPTWKVASGFPAVCVYSAEYTDLRDLRRVTTDLQDLWGVTMDLRDLQGFTTDLRDVRDVCMGLDARGSRLVLPMSHSVFMMPGYLESLLLCVETISTNARERDSEVHPPTLRNNAD